ncbi:interferon-inducible GTPase 5-like [Emys orbicularis]|uniref:interferon-inducible GTPase 5-like n=1 Tax=Emys orbicularis TaxID=82168 RepID=UPI0031FDF2A4
MAIDLDSDQKEVVEMGLQSYGNLLAHLETEDPSEAACKVKEELESFENATLNIAITGETGAGKSSFINAIRGVGHEDENAAATGETETTRKPTPYPHPTYPQVTFWDMPGVETPDFQIDQYPEKVNFDSYDFFIIIASERFKSSHAKLAREIRGMGKKFYFVRSKVDADLYNAKKQRPSTYKEEKILEMIKENCIQHLEAEGMTSPKVFLLSSFDLEKYDFLDLVDTLEHELPSHKRHAFLLSLPNVSPQTLQKKKEALKQQIWKLALLLGAASGGVAAIPGSRSKSLSLAFNVPILLKCMRDYSKSFGLEDDSLEKLAQHSGKSVNDLKAVIKTPLAKDLTVKYVWELLSQSPVLLTLKSMGALLSSSMGAKLQAMTETWMLVADFSEYCGKVLPVLCALTASGISYSTTSFVLHRFLDAVAEDAQRIREVVLEEEGKKSI